MTKLEEIIVKYPMDVGAACPVVFCSDLHLTLLFYIDVFSPSGPFDTIKERDSENDTGIAVMNFSRSYIHKFGTPNDETLSGHPYYKIGLRHYSFFKIQDSDWIKEIMRIASNHPYYNESRYGNLNHYILTFKEGVFECIAEDYTIDYSFKSMSETLLENIELLKE